MEECGMRGNLNNNDQSGLFNRFKSSSNHKYNIISQQKQSDDYYFKDGVTWIDIMVKQLENYGVSADQVNTLYEDIIEEEQDTDSIFMDIDQYNDNNKENSNIYNTLNNDSTFNILQDLLHTIKVYMEDFFLVVRECGIYIRTEHVEHSGRIKKDLFCLFCDGKKQIGSKYTPFP